MTYIEIADLPEYRQDAVRATISAGGIVEADQIPKDLRTAAGG